MIETQWQVHSKQAKIPLTQIAQLVLHEVHQIQIHQENRLSKIEGLMD